MEKTIAAASARRQFGKVLDDVVAKGDDYVVERHGEQVAAVVPIHVYKQLKRSREEFFELLRAGAERANLSPEEADKLAEEAVRAVRAVPG